PDDASRLAAGTRELRELSAGRSRTPGIPRADSAQSAHRGRPGRRDQRAALDPRVEPFRRHAGGRTRASLFFRLAFRATAPERGAADLPQPVQAIRAT